jgi:hypothetical protein
MPAKRSYEIRLPGTLPPAAVRCNGKQVPYAPREGAAGWRYDGERTSTIITLGPFPRSQHVSVAVRAGTPPEEHTRVTAAAAGILSRLRRATALINSQWPKEWSPDSLVAAAQTGNRATIRPASAAREFARLQRELPKLLAEIGALEIGAPLARRIVNHCAPLLAPAASRARKR